MSPRLPGPFQFWTCWCWASIVPDFGAQALRVAIVSPVGGLTKFFENVARNRGVQIAVVPNQEAAMEWLR